MTQGFSEMINKEIRTIGKFKGRKIIDYVLARRPDFDPKKHVVLVNNTAVDPSRLDSKLGPLDVILVKEV